MAGGNTPQGSADQSKKARGLSKSTVTIITALIAAAATVMAAWIARGPGASANAQPPAAATTGAVTTPSAAASPGAYGVPGQSPSASPADSNCSTSNPDVSCTVSGVEFNITSTQLAAGATYEVDEQDGTYLASATVGSSGSFSLSALIQEGQTDYKLCQEGTSDVIAQITIS